MVRSMLNREESAKLAVRVAQKYNAFKGDKKKTWVYFKREGFKYSTIWRWIKTAEESGGSCEIKVQRGLPPKIKTPENMKRIVEILKENPSISASELARKLDMTVSTVRDMLNEFRNGNRFQDVGNITDSGLHNQPDPVNGPNLSPMPPASPFTDLEFAFDDGGSASPVERDSRCHGVRSCFLCKAENAQELDFSLTPCPKTPEELGPAEVETSLKVVCFLKNVLGMRIEDIAFLLEETGGTSPSEWGISLCTDPGCKEPVERAFDIWMEIKKLDAELRKKREAIFERLKRHRAGEEMEDDHLFLRERVREAIKEGSSQENATNSLEPQVKIEIEADNLCDNDDTGWDGNFDDDMQQSEIKVESSCDTLCRRSSRSKRGVIKFKPDFPPPKKSRSILPKKGQKSGLNSKLKEMKSAGHLIFGSSDEIIYSCHLCPRLGNMDIDKFIAHIAFHSMHPQKCTKCSSYFAEGVSMEEKVQNHWQDRHPDSQSIDPKVTQVSAVDAAGKIWLCSRAKCKAPFQNAEERNSHELTVHGIEPSAKAKFNCPLCPSKLKNVKELRLHKAMEHAEEAVVSCCYCDTKLAIQSEKEDVKFLNIDELKKHISEAHPDRWSKQNLPRFLQTCHFCGLVFQFKDHSKLDSHIAQEHGQKLHETYTCPICQKKMRNGDAWKHTIRHWPDAPRKYVCQFCGKGFPRQTTQLNHEKIHKNQITRPFQCELCGSSFAVSTYLYIHRRVTHQGHVWPSALRKRKQAARNKVVPNSIDNLETELDPRPTQGP